MFAVELVEPPVLVVSIVVVLFVVESVVLVESPLLLHDQIVAADKQMAKENNFFFIKWFLCDELQKIYASTWQKKLPVQALKMAIVLKNFCVMHFGSRN